MRAHSGYTVPYYRTSSTVLYKVVPSWQHASDLSTVLHAFGQPSVTRGTTVRYTRGNRPLHAG